LREVCDVVSGERKRPLSRCAVTGAGDFLDEAASKIGHGSAVRAQARVN
jgi:hypothetical protein